MHTPGLVPEGCRHLDHERVKRALAEAHGSVSDAAKALKVKSVYLRRMVYLTSDLAAAMFEQYELGLDMAIAVLWKGLRSENLSQQLEAAKFLLTCERA